MLTKIPAFCAMALSTVCAFTPAPPSSLSSVRQISSISRQTCALTASRMQSLPSAGKGENLDRRAMLRTGVSTILAAGFASDAFAASGKGDWARHDGPFSDSEFEGFSQTPSGLKYKDIEVGQGPQPKSGQKIKAHWYLLSNGKLFDSSYDRGQPLPFNVGVGQVIKGWDEGLLSMKVGGKRILLIPSELAYGKRNVANGLIPPNSVLVFYVELVSLAA